MLLEGALETRRKHRCFGTSGRPGGSRDETSQLPRSDDVTTLLQTRPRVSQSIPTMPSILLLIPIDTLITQYTNVVASALGSAAAADAGNKLLAAEPLSSSKRQ